MESRSINNHNVAYPMGHPSNYPEHGYPNVPPDYPVKYPPSMAPSRYIPMLSGGPAEHRGTSGQVAVTEIIKQLDFATRENKRLKEEIEENNCFMEQKFQDLVQPQNQPKIIELEKEVENLKGKVSEATNRFFEARVAVMGFKCRVMQLQGEMERKQQTSPGHFQELEVEQKSLVEVNSQLRRDLEALGNKKGLVEEERNRLRHEMNGLQDQVRDKETTIQRLNVHLSQVQTDRHSSHDHTLLGQIQELMKKKSALEGEVTRTKQNNDNLKQSNDNLLTKMKDLQESREVMIQKLERLESMSPTGPMPVPKPRTGSSSAVEKGRLEHEVGRLEHEVQRIQRENTSLQSEKEQLSRDKHGVDTMFQDSNRKSQNLQEGMVSLQGELSKLQQVLDQERDKVQQLEAEKSVEERNVKAEVSHMLERSSEDNKGLRLELEELRMKLRGVDKEKRSLSSQLERMDKTNRESMEELETLQQAKEELRRQVRQYKTQITQQETPVAESAELKSYTSIKNLSAKRLNDALGKIKELETYKDDADDQMSDLKEAHSRKLRQVQDQVESLEVDLKLEKEDVSKAAMDDLSVLRIENAQLQDKEQQMSFHMRQFEVDQQRHVEESLRLRGELDRCRQDLTHQDTEKRGLTHQISEKQSEAEQLREQLSGLQNQLDTEAKSKNRKSSKLETLQQNYSDLKATHTTVVSSHDQLQAQVKDTQTRMHIISEEKQRVVAEKEDLQSTCEEFRKESESILLDYNSCAQRLKVTQEDAARWTAQHQKDSSELNRQRDRIGLLEQSRKEQDEKLTHMDQQIKIYHEDFDRERNAREAAVKVKNLAEDRMKKMDRELKELRERLNQQAARSLREEPYEDNSYSSSPSHLEAVSPQQRYSGPHSKPGEQYPASQPPTGWNPATNPAPASHHHHTQHSQQERKSAELVMNNNPSATDGGPPYGGGRGRSAGGGQGSHNIPWTQINPATPISSHPSHYHPRTTLDPQGPPQPHVRGSGRDIQMGNNPPSPPVHMGNPTKESYRDYQAQPAQQRHFPPLDTSSGVSGVRQQEHGLGPRQPGGLEPFGIGQQGGMEPGEFDTGGGGILPPGEMNNSAPPTMACPICNRANFKTQTDLEVHSAQCVGH